MPSNAETMTILYDGACPICRQATYLPNIAPGICTVDARTESTWRQQATDHHVDLDRGFAVFHQGQIYAGHQAAHFLATQLPATTDWRAAATRLLFGGRIRSRLLYPLAVWSRRMILAIKRAPMIDNLAQQNIKPDSMEQKS